MEKINGSGELNVLYFCQTLYARTGCDRPTMKDLKDHVVPLVATEWYDLGIQLLHQNELKSIALNTRNNPNMCCEQMFYKWLMMDQIASWNKLIHAVEDIDLHYAAAVIENMLIQGENVTDLLYNGMA